ncbi:Fructose dehydrogenase cytochrome subunit [Bradyrhizobium ivorense]|uniref:Fructose dehydrogenase cytochrome subunit n=1 Tax=Bradyrhizobium ivorense TaxID=2511166 RepID=A0A508TGD5_9BRAD|nr:hypothetical protein [Bradyrhizobium ivorense]MCC8939790.1 hypothetical protein [Bradyrhizobium ivorense]VIO73168.1 Fructose dehydrogenase cytochrome subunit [Bradyrhizobium ivorense]
MPGFGGRPTDANPLSDRNIATLSNFVLTHYGSADTTITEQQVAEARQGGPSSPLLALARGSTSIVAAIAFLGVAFLLVRRRKLRRVDGESPVQEPGYHLRRKM